MSRRRTEECSSQHSRSAPAAAPPEAHSSAPASREQAGAPAPAAGGVAHRHDQTWPPSREEAQTDIVHGDGPQQDRREEPNANAEANFSNPRRLFGRPLSRNQLDALFQQDELEVRMR